MNFVASQLCPSEFLKKYDPLENSEPARSARAYTSAYSSSSGQANLPPIVFLGSSLVNAALLNANPAFLPHHFNWAISGQHPSDAYFISKAMFTANSKPKLLIYGLAPRDLMNNSLPSPASTETVRLFSHVLNVFSLPSNTFIDLTDRASFTFNRSIFQRDRRECFVRISTDLLNSLLRDINAPQLISADLPKHPSDPSDPSDSSDPKVPSAPKVPSSSKVTSDPSGSKVTSDPKESKVPSESKVPEAPEVLEVPEVEHTLTVLPQKIDVPVIAPIAHNNSHATATFSGNPTCLEPAAMTGMKVPPGFVPTKEWTEKVQHVIYHVAYRPFNSEKYAGQLSFLEGVVEHCYNQGIAVVLLKMPQRAKDIAIMPDGLLERYNRDVDLLAKKYGATVIDMNDQHKFSDEDFADLVHLNASGAERFRHRLVDSLSRSAVSNLIADKMRSRITVPEI